ncbi:hypothetical protein [Streptomyces sp. JJ36]|uniref:hypothetical protein n=1 Tax=Streptomyces sp. JJ36 TaxID=2736645 RepID=UPI001F3DDC94|nr:hypothetical protein [Streptomyces sp. JJ36]MCF6526549.1 hypothetical protein [Streptomyces sp. JJ36]
MSLTKVEMIGGAVWISDLDPEDAALIRNASAVLDHARALLRSPELSAHEARFTARALADALYDVLVLNGQR